MDAQMLTGCKKKPRRSMASKMTNVCAAKRKANLLKVPKKCSIKAGFPKVYYQHYGNCTANAVLGCDDYLFHGSGKWIPSTTFTYYNQKRKEKPMVDDGSCVEEALMMVKKYGACNSKIWPNDINPWNTKPSKEAYADGLKGKEVKKWYELKNMKQMKQALVAGYPIACAVAWCFKNYDENFVMNTPTKKEVDHAPSGHAIVIVGYDDDTKLVEFRNSWSELWGNKGYAYMTYETFKLVVWWNDTYAVTG